MAVEVTTWSDAAPWPWTVENCIGRPIRPFLIAIGKAFQERFGSDFVDKPFHQDRASFYYEDFVEWIDSKLSDYLSDYWVSRIESRNQWGWHDGNGWQTLDSILAEIGDEERYVATSRNTPFRERENLQWIIQTAHILNKLRWQGRVWSWQDDQPRIMGDNEEEWFYEEGGVIVRENPHAAVDAVAGWDWGHSHIWDNPGQYTSWDARVTRTSEGSRAWGQVLAVRFSAAGLSNQVYLRDELSGLLLPDEVLWLVNYTAWDILDLQSFSEEDFSVSQSGPFGVDYLTFSFNPGIEIPPNVNPEDPLILPGTPPISEGTYYGEMLGWQGTNTGNILVKKFDGVNGFAFLED